MKNLSINSNKNVSSRFLSSNYYDESLIESENFRVVPSLGSLIPDWVLIIPKDQCISISQINPAFIEEFIALKEHICEIFLGKYGYYTAFEHGAQYSNTLVGCGVDYAHLHIVPNKTNLIEVTEQYLLNKYTWENCKSLEFLFDLTNNLGTSYLYYEQNECAPIITFSNNIPSQLFRKAIAVSLGELDSYDWKAFPNHENIKETISTFSKYKAFKFPFKKVYV